MIAAAYTHITIRVRGQIAPTAIAAATAVVAWPDGMLANAGFQANGTKANGSSCPPTKGRARPINRLTIETNNPGSAIATNTKPSRAPRAANTACAAFGKCGEVTAAKNNNAKPQGNRNHPDKPNFVISSNAALNQCGSPRAQPTALASRATIEIAAAANRATATAMIPGECGSFSERAGRTNTRKHSAIFSDMFRTMRCTANSGAAPSPTGIAFTGSKSAFGAFTECSLFRTPQSTPPCRC